MTKKKGKGKLTSVGHGFMAAHHVAEVPRGFLGWLSSKAKGYADKEESDGVISQAGRALVDIFKAKAHEMSAPNKDDK